MTSDSFQLSDYNRIIIRQFLFIFIFTIILTIIGAIVGIYLPETYEATAKIKIDYSRIYDNTEVDNDELYLLTSLKDNLSEISADLSGQTILLSTAQSLGIISDTISIARITPDAIATIAMYRNRLSIVPNGVENTISISATGTSAKETTTLVNTVCSVYVSYSLEQKHLYLNKKEQKIRVALDTCQAQLAAFAKKMISLGEGHWGLSYSSLIKNKYKHIEALQQSYQMYNYRLFVLSSLARELRTFLFNAEYRGQHPESSTPSDTILWPPHFHWMSELSIRNYVIRKSINRLDSLRDKRSKLITFFRREHPSIVSTDSVILSTVRTILNAVNRMESENREKRSAVKARYDLLTKHVQVHIPRKYTLDRLQEKYQEKEKLCASIDGQLTTIHETINSLSPYITIASSASVPVRPKGPSVVHTTIAGFAAGLLLGIFLAIFREIANTSLSTIEDVHRLLPGYTIAGIIPDSTLGIKTNNTDPVNAYNATALPVLFSPESKYADAFKLLSCSLNSNAADKKMRSLLITSSIDGEGKSYIAANCALSLANQKKQVLLIDGNNRNPSLCGLFGLPALPGLMEILTEKHTPDECIVSVSDLLLGSFPFNLLVNVHGIDHFSFLPAGKPRANSGELLSSSVMHNCMQQFKNVYDFLIIDSPSAHLAHNPLVLSSYCDGFCVVYRYDTAPRKVLLDTIHSFEKPGKTFLGLVLNQWRDEREKI